jgi:nucleotide-binding universal stress UspA family protein
MEVNIKSILVPFDSSGSSTVALGAAIAMADVFNAKVTLLFVQDVNLKVQHVNSTSLSDFVAKLKEDQKADIDFIIRDGKVYKEIVKAATEIDTDIIIMGTHSVMGFQEYWVGSNAYKVATTAPCPVITMQEHIKHKTFEKIVLPIDTSRDTRQKVPMAIALAKVTGSEIHVLAVSSDKEGDDVITAKNYAHQVHGIIKDAGVNVVMETSTGRNIATLTIDYAQKINADLIMIMTDQESGSVFMGPFAQQLINHSPYPVMSIKPKEVYISYATI